MRLSKPIIAVCLLFVMLAAAGGCVRPKAVPKPGAESAKPMVHGKRILLVVSQSNFSDQYFESLNTIFTTAGAERFLAAPLGNVASSTKGQTFPTDTSLELAHADQYDAVVFVGGKGASALFENEDALRLAQETSEQGKVLGAGGAATLILGLAGVLEGKTATAPPRLAKSFTDVAKCTYSDQPVVTDETIVTAGTSDAANEFAETIVRLLR